MLLSYVYSCLAAAPCSVATLLRCKQRAAAAPRQASSPGPPPESGCFRPATVGWRARVPRGFPAEERKCSDRKSHNPGSMSERARLPESGCLSPATVEWRARALIVFNYIFHSHCFVRRFIFPRYRRSGVLLKLSLCSHNLFGRLFQPL